MSSRDRSNIRKPAIKKKKSAWEIHKDTIIRLYKDKTLEEVREEMEASYGFRANKRQYVYRLQVWNARKYNSPPPDQDQSQISGYPALQAPGLNHDPKVVPSNSFQGQAPLSSPAQDVGRAALDSMNQDDSSMQWLMKMRVRKDALLVLPRNQKAFDDYIYLQQSTPTEDKTGTGYRAIVDACVFSALADKIDSERKDRIDATRRILAEGAEFPPTGGVDRLRRRLQAHVLHIQTEGGPGRTMEMLRDVVLKQPLNHDLNMFLLLTLFGSFVENHAAYEENIMVRYIQSIRESQEARETLDGGIAWCKSVCKEAEMDPHKFQIDCSNPSEHLQLNMANVSCLLFTKLLSEREELPPWAQNIEETLGISKTTFAVALVCMAWGHRERHSPPEIDFTPYQRVYHGLKELKNIQPSTIWRMFLRAFVQIHKVAFTGHIHTFTSAAADQSPCSEVFLKQLNEAVCNLIGDYPPSELSETTSVSNGPLTPTSTQESYYNPQMDFMQENEGFGEFYDDFNNDTFENGKNLSSYLQIGSSQDIGMD